MFAKVFASLWQGSMIGRSDLQLVFIYMLANCDAKGVFDQTPEVVSALTGLSLERVEEAIRILESPDPRSRTATDDGRDANAILGRSEEFILGNGEQKTGLNVGVHSRTVTQLDGVTAHRVLPEVSAANLSPMQTKGEPLALLVIAMVITMFGSLIAAFVVPRRRAAPGMNQWVASDHLTVTADR